MMRFAFAMTALALALGLASGPACAAIFSPTDMTLDNGLEVIVVPNHLAPVVTQMVWYKVGAADEEKGKNGLAHYLEHLMFRGTGNVKPGAFSKLIAAQGGDDNAFTSYDYTAYHEEVEASRLPMIMQLEADRMRNLHITAATATPELSVVLNERQQRTDNDPEGRFVEVLDDKFMPHYPYGRPVIGWKNEIEGLTPQDAESFYHAHYAPNNAVVIITGDVDAGDVMRLAEKFYGDIPRRDIAARPVWGSPPLPSQKVFRQTDAGIEQPTVIWRLTAPSYATQKGNDAYAYEVLAEVLDGGEVGLLYGDLVRDRKVASSVETSYDPDARGVTSFTLAASPAPGRSADELRHALQAALQKFAVSGIAADKINLAKQRMQRAAIFAREGLLMPGYAFGMAVTTGHTVADVEAWPERIDAVTPEQVNAVLRALAANRHAIIGVLSPDPHASAAQREAAQPIINHGVGIR